MNEINLFVSDYQNIIKSGRSFMCSLLNLLNPKVL